MPASKYEGVLASFYDADHQWRDYGRQSAFFDRLFPAGLARKNLKVLDLCCGSGSHSILLAQKGFRVTAVDRSNEMLLRAKKKREGKKWDLTFRKREIFSREFREEFHSRFDGMLLMGWTLALGPIYERFSDLLEIASEVLKPGGIFAFDAPMGTHFNPVPPAPLRYRISPSLRGTLRISEKRDFKKSSCTYFYDWKIDEKRPSGQKSLRSDLRAEETLVILKPEDVLSKLEDRKGRLEILSLSGDYDTSKPFRKGSKNLVAAVRKTHVLGH